MGLIGLNAPGRAEHSPRELRDLGSKSARCVAYPDFDLTAWLRECQRLRLETILILGSESIGHDESRWAGAITDFRRRYGGLPTYWQIGNEPDARPNEQSSWNMSPSQYNRLLRTARIELGPEARLLTAGLVSGNPSWLNTVELQHVNGVAYHPYGKNPGALWRGEDWGTGEWLPLHLGYKAIADRYRLPLFVTEVGWQTEGNGAIPEELQAEYLTVMLRTISPHVASVLWFCRHDYLGFGLTKDGRRKPAYDAFVRVARPRFQAGFEVIAKAEPELVGEPLEDESAPIAETALQETSTGYMLWGNNLHAHIGRDGTIRYWDGSRLVTVATPDGPPPVEAPPDPEPEPEPPPDPEPPPEPQPEPEPTPEPTPAPSDPAWRYWSAEQIASASGCPVAAVRENWPKVWEALRAHHIDGRLEQMAAIATIAIETASTFAPVREAFWMSEEWRKDNLRYWPHYGRGFIQLTWDYNYRAYGAALGFDLIGNPDLALDPFVSAMVLARYFVDRKVADAAAAQDWPEVRRRVLGATTGLDRLLRIVAALEGTESPPAASQYVFPVEGYTGDVPLHWGSHPGAADLFAPEGTPVKAIDSGVVSSAGFSDIGGNNVLITHDQGILGYYAHGDRTPAVRTGQRVERGTFLFGVGDTGNAAQAGPHLHIGGGPNIANGTGPQGGAGVNPDGSPFDFRSILLAALGQVPSGPRFAVVGVGADGLNVRAAPETGEVLKTLPEGQVVEGGERAWRRVWDDEAEGFAANEFLERR
jgi:murein DD-endopeptidase MepM/ murein hydrolase activator NlpD